jgi:hypothetical protein
LRFGRFSRNHLACKAYVLDTAFTLGIALEHSRLAFVGFEMGVSRRLVNV